MNVLIVDDDAITRQFLAFTLRNAGYTVCTARNGEEAFERFLIDQFQLIVSDWSMPKMDGLDLCRAVRRADCRSYVYFILLTTHDRPEDAITGLGAGADDYVRKPVDPGELIMRVNAGQRVINLETRGLTIFALAKLAESRDPETGEHLERVRNYCRLLSKTMSEIHSRYQGIIDDDFTQLIYETSPLHDIGKVAIPDSILLKPGRLTDDEFAVMKTHTQRGAETIAAMRSVFPNARFLEMAHAIILSHHEKFDGSGYPHGIAGEAIPLCARIMAVADVYDALTSVRVYKAAYTHDDAVRIILRDSGRHFDPDVVAAFQHCLADFDRLRALHSETPAEPPAITPAQTIPVLA